MTPEQKRATRDAFAHAHQIERDLEADYPGLWSQLDQMRSTASVTWPDWCLLPMGAAVAVAQTNPSAVGNATIAQIAAAYTWRYTRSVYLVEPHLMGRLLTQVPDALTVDDLATLPEWCIYVITEHPEYPGGGFWAHLEHDTGTSRPELRLIIDLDEPTPIPVYLDRDSTTEALADMRATARASMGGRTGADTRSGELSLSAADLADYVDGCLGILAYLARTEADIVHAEHPDVSPVKPRKPKQEKDVWLVGYSNRPA